MLKSEELESSLRIVAALELPDAAVSEFTLASNCVIFMPSQLKRRLAASKGS
jgi:hypothetical protein